LSLWQTLTRAPVSGVGPGLRRVQTSENTSYKHLGE
jgi:hypothetical protein